uniref:Transporter substrate-binding domain-containing protein n=1 Tax=Desertifilum tharense IPPAS B-1220 TaxID=1781255 RepID=A0ACD5GTY6_9CYAN
MKCGRLKNEKSTLESGFFKLQTLHFLLCFGLLAVPGLATTSQRIMASAQLQRIQRRGYLTVAVKDNLRPLGFRDSEENLQGLEIEIAQRLAAEILGDRNAIRWLPANNQERLALVAEGRVDLAIARLSVTGSRSRLVDFSTPYYIDGTAFVTRQPAIDSLEAIGQQTIAVLNDSTTVAYVRYFIPNANLVGVDSYQEALALLEAGEAATFAADATVLTGWVQEYPQYRLLPFLISADALAIAMPRGLQHDAFRRKVNQAIAQWRSEGWLRERAQFWGLPLPQ